MKFIDERLTDYSISKSSLPSTLCNELEQYTRQNISMPQMLVGKMEASFLGFLIRSQRAKRILEIETFTGYSALAMAENLCYQGEIITLDINPETAKVARDFWSKSPHGHKIKQKLGPALESLKEISGLMDLVFIDADKENYLAYLQKTLPLLSDKGIIVIDNVLWSGQVLSNSASIATQGIQRLNDYVARRNDLYSTLLPIRDGMLLIQKKDHS